MTPAARAFFDSFHRRAGRLSPEAAAALLKAWRRIAESYSEREMASLIATGRIERLLAQAFSEAKLDAALAPVRDRIRGAVSEGVRFTGQQLPRAAAREIVVAFNILSPDVITAVRALETRALGALKDDVRETVRAYVENGLRDGVAPRTVARQLRSVIGLAPNQEAAVRNFERMLRDGDREALTRALRDRRFDATLNKAFGADGKALTQAQIETMTAAYRKRMVAFNANTISRTTTLDSMKLGQRLSIDKAIELGVYDADRLKKTWVGVMDERERPEHVAMEGDTVAYDASFSNGEMIPGESSYNCRCLARYFSARAA